MTDAQKEQVRYLRCEGLGYGAIATRLGISEIRSRAFAATTSPEWLPKSRWWYAGTAAGRFLNIPRENQRKFCSEACRRAWWKLHPELIHKAAFYPATCAIAGRNFRAMETGNGSIVPTPAI